MNRAGASRSPRRRLTPSSRGRRHDASTRPANLPIPITSFVGREDELARLQTALRGMGKRFITLTGPVGCGKSRLAIEAAATLADAFRDGIVWVDLANLAHPEEGAEALLRAVGDFVGTRLTSPGHLSRVLANRSLLLVLDGCEGKTPDLTPIVVDVLQSCPGVRVLATSRETFGLRGESVWTVPLLAFPPALPTWSREHPAPRGSETAAELLDYDAIRLFVDRATSVAPGFAMTDENAATIVHICQRLEGNPLAIERAALSARVLTPDEIATWLRDSLRVLDDTGRGRAAQRPNQWASLEQDYTALSEPQRRLFRRLSVFRGSAAFEAIRSVAAPDAPAIEVLNRLAGLANKSLLLVEQNGAQTRYRLLALAREFGGEQLQAGEADAVRQAHARFYLALAMTANEHIRSGQATARLAQLETEQANLEAALQNTLADAPDIALRLAGALARYWEVRGHVVAGRQWLEDVLAATPDVPSLARAQALDGAGALAHNQSDYQHARLLHEQARDMRRALGDSHGLAVSLYNLAMLAKDSGDYAESERLFDDSLALFQMTEDRSGRAYALLNYGILKHVQGEYRASTTLFDESLAEMRRLEDAPGLAAALSNRGLAARNQGHYIEAETFHTEALAIRRALGDTLGIALSLTNLGFLAYDQDNLSTAAEFLHHALEHFRNVDSQWGIGLALIGLGQMAAQQGDRVQAVQFVGEGLTIYKDVGYQWGISMALYAQAMVRLSMGNTTGALDAAQKSLALRQELQDRHGIAECLEMIAVVAAADGYQNAVARLDGAAAALRQAINAPRSPLENKRLALALASAQEAAIDYAALRDAGARMPLEEILAYALRPSLLDLEQALTQAPAPAIQPRHARWLAPDATMLYDVRIHGLGAGQVYRDDRLLAPSAWSYAKPRELLYYLLSYPNRTKEQIGVALWPDASPSQLRSALHSALHRMRRALGEHDCVLVEDETYSFNHNMSYWYDVEVFEAHLSEAARLRDDASPQAIYHLQAAVDLYQGDFLERVGGATDWIFLRREGLRQRFIEALLTLGQILFAQRRYDQAADAYRRAITVDSYLEAAHRELMRCYVRQGERSQAIRHYQHLVAILHQELHVAPAEETTSLYERLIAGYGI